MRKIFLMVIWVSLVVIMIQAQDGVSGDKEVLLVEMKSVEENIEKESEEIIEWINESEKELIEQKKLLEQKCNWYNTFINNCISILKSLSQREIEVETEITVIEWLKETSPQKELTLVNKNLMILSLLKSRIESRKLFHHILNLLAERKNEKEIQEWVERLKTDLEMVKKEKVWLLNEGYSVPYN